MTRRRAPIALIVLTLAILAASSTSALAGGLPGGGGYLQAKGVVAPAGAAGGASRTDTTGVVSPSGDARYVALPTPGSATIVLRIDPSDGRVVSRARVAGGYTIPTVAVDGSPGGLSADGQTLVLTQPLARFPQAVTRIKIFTAPDLRLRREIILQGTYSFDAISPDGEVLYLIQYTSPTDPTQYLVRAYDADAGHLLKAPIVDPSEGGRQMTGRPVTRAMSRDGRWAYTLYDGSDEGPFVHALDTTARRAVCVDLEGISLPRNLQGSDLSISSDGRNLIILRDGATAALVDTQTFRASPPSEPAASEGDGDAWRLVIPTAVVVAFAGCVLFLILRRRGDQVAPGGA